MRTTALTVFSTLNKGMDIFCYIHKNSFLDEDISSGVISGILFKDCSSLVNYTVVSSSWYTENSIKSCV